MAAATLNLTVEQGASFSRTITIQDSHRDDVDLTGWTIAGKIRSLYDSSTVAASWTCTLLNQTTNRGEFTISLTHSETAGMAAEPSTGPFRKETPFLYDVEATLPDGSKRRLIQGNLYLSPEVTR